MSVVLGEAEQKKFQGIHNHVFECENSTVIALTIALIAVNFRNKKNVGSYQLLVNSTH